MGDFLSGIQHKEATLEQEKREAGKRKEGREEGRRKNQNPPGCEELNDIIKPLGGIDPSHVTSFFDRLPRLKSDHPRKLVR